MIFLAQSTAVNIYIGPFVSAGDGTTVLDALTIASTTMWVSKNLGSPSHISGAPTIFTQGIYTVSVGVADTNTAGPFQLWVKATGALYVWHEYMVLPGTVYNAWVSGTANFSADVKTISTACITNASFASSAIDSTKIASSAIDSTKIAAGAITVTQAPNLDATISSRASASLWTSAIAGNIDATISSRASATVWTSTLAGRIDANVSSAVSAASLALVAIDLDHLLHTLYDPASVPGSPSGLLNVLVENNGGVPRWTAASLVNAPTGGSAPTALSIASAVWDKTLASHTTITTMGGALGSNLDATISSRASATIWTSMIAGRIDASVSSAVSAASLALTAYSPLTTAHGDAIAASLALTSYAPLTTTQGNALAASLALTSYGALTAVAFASIGARIDDSITSRASATIWTSALATILASTGVQKNTLLPGFEFLMVDETDGKTAETGLTVTSTRSIDGTAFGACVNSATEVGFGIYKIDLAAADLNGDVITLRFTAAGALDRFITIKTNQ
jgi:hypothetical protein